METPRKRSMSPKAKKQAIGGIIASLVSAILMYFI